MTYNKHGVSDYISDTNYSSPFFSNDSNILYYQKDDNNGSFLYSYNILNETTEKVSESLNIDKWTNVIPLDHNSFIFQQNIDGIDGVNFFDKSSKSLKGFTPLSTFAYGNEIIGRDGKFASYAEFNKNTENYDIFLHDISKNKRVCVGDGGKSCMPFGLSPKNKYITSYNKTDNGSYNIVLIDIDNATTKVILSVPAQNIFLPFARWLPNDSGFYFMKNDGDGFYYVYFYSIEKEEYSLIYKPDCELHSISISPDGSSIICMLNRDGYTIPVFLDTKTGRTVDSLQIPSGVSIVPVWSPDGSAVACIFSCFTKPHEICIWKKSTNSWSKITESKTKVSDISLIEPMFEKFKTFDDLEIPTYIYKPIGVDVNKKISALVFMHGGPNGQYRAKYDALAQFLVNNGVAFIAPNIRGSGGYGAEYKKMDDKEKRFDAISDLEFLHKHIRNIEFIDANNIFLMGESYGGYLALCGLTMQSDLWKGVIDEAGMSDLVLHLKDEPQSSRKFAEEEYGCLEEDMDLLQKLSPMNYVEKVKAPLLIAHGAKDKKSRPNQATLMHEKMQKFDKESELLIYEDENHCINKRENKIDFYNRVLKFLSNDK